MKIFNELQLDVLKEFINVAFGSATASIAELLNAFATLHTPQITVIKAQEIDKYISELSKPKEKKYQAQQIFNGDISGETVFLINEESTINLSKRFYGDISLNEAHIKDSILELNNILSITTIGKLSELTDLSSEFLPPTLKKVIDDKHIEKADIIKYPAVIIISTVLEFEDEKIKGTLFILSTEKMIETLRDSIDATIKEQFPDYGN